MVVHPATLPTSVGSLRAGDKRLQYYAQTQVYLCGHAHVCIGMHSLCYLVKQGLETGLCPRPPLEYVAKNVSKLLLGSCINYSPVVAWVMSLV